MDIIERARQLRAVIESMAADLTDEKALNNKELYPSWNGEGVAYNVGDRVRYENKLYKVLQAHTSQTSWTPKDAASLFAEVLIPDPEVIPEWVQPSSTNPYMKGDKVKHNGKTWQSLIDNNVWEPTETVPTLWQEV